MSVGGIGGDHETLPQSAQQRFLPHHPQHPEAFFRISVSRASFPQNRSNSAILASSASVSELCFSLKASSPLASYSLRHRKSTL